MSTAITPLLKRFIVCPECRKGDFCIQHLLDEEWGAMERKAGKRNFGPWYCRECGLGVCFCTHQDGQITLEDPMPLQEKRTYKQYVLVEIPIREKPLHLLCQHIRFTPQLTEESRSNTRFRFEENTHPINVFHEISDMTDDISIKVIDIFDDVDKGQEARLKLDYPDMDDEPD